MWLSALLYVIKSSRLLLVTVQEKQLDGSVRTYVDEDLKQAIALKLLEEIPNFPLKEAERGAKEKINGI